MNMGAQISEFMMSLPHNNQLILYGDWEKKIQGEKNAI